MEESLLERRWIKRIRFLTQALVISGALNLAFVATFCFYILQERRGSVVFDLQPASDSAAASRGMSNAQVLQSYCEKSFYDLLDFTNQKNLLEDGYTRRDLALSILVGFHQFNLERALGGTPFQKRHILFSPHVDGEQIELAIFPELTDEQFQAIRHYARTEKWPFTTQGLYFEIKRRWPKCEESLLETFYLSHEFVSLLTLFSRTQCSLEKEKILALVCEGDWTVLQKFMASQKEIQDFSVEKRRMLLVQYLEARSKIAARLLLMYDCDFVAKRLNDEQVAFVLDVADVEMDQQKKLAKALLCSTRSDRIWKMAAAKLYAGIQESLPEPYDHLSTIRRFCPEFLSSVIPPLKSDHQQMERGQPPPPLAIRQPCVHVVEEGDSLWKIARRYRVKIEAIMQANHLESERLKPGQKLEIP